MERCAAPVGGVARGAQFARLRLGAARGGAAGYRRAPRRRLLSAGRQPAARQPRGVADSDWLVGAEVLDSDRSPRATRADTIRLPVTGMFGREHIYLREVTESRSADAQIRGQQTNNAAGNNNSMAYAVADTRIDA